MTTTITLELTDDLLAAVDDWRSKRQPSPSREQAVRSVLDAWAREKTGPLLQFSDGGTPPENLNASNDD